MTCPWFSFCLSCHFVWQLSFTGFCFLTCWMTGGCYGLTCLPVCWQYAKLHLQPCSLFSSLTHIFYSLIKVVIGRFIMNSTQTLPSPQWGLLLLRLSLFSVGIPVSCLSRTEPQGLWFSPLAFLPCPAYAVLEISLNSVLFSLYLLPLI